MSDIDMRLRFEDIELKGKLLDLSLDIGVGLNKLVNMILSAQFDDKARKSLQLAKDIAEYKRIVAESN